MAGLFSDSQCRSIVNSAINIAENLEKGAPSRLMRYSIRQDGFASFKAPYSGATLVTKPFVFEGDSLLINFRTSAAGNVYITLRDEDGNEAKSCELFGNAIDRRVSFDKPISDFAGKAVRMEFKMSDAEMYSFKFD